MLFWIGSILIVVCVIVEGFFSGSEIAIISIDRIKLRHLVSRGSKGARQAQTMLQQPERFLGTTLVGTNISVVSASVLLTVLLTNIPHFPDTLQAYLSAALAHLGIDYTPTLPDSIEFYVAICLTPIVLIFGEIVPKSVLQQHANTLVPVLAPLLNVAFKLFYPVVLLVSTITNALLLLVRVEKKLRRQTLTRDELKFLVRTDVHGSFADPQRKELMRRVFEFGDKSVKDVLVPLVDVVAFEKGMLLAEAVERIQQCGFSRIPIYEDRVDHLIGVIHAFDLLRATSLETTIDPFIRKAYYVPETMRLDHLLHNMQRHHTQIAIVVDEYGGSLGIVTIEDSLEEIVGEIEDEFDEFSEALYKKLPDGSYRISARMEIDALNETLHFGLPNGSYETLGGFLLAEFRRIPVAGETLVYRQLRFKIEEANDRAILRVQVARQPEV
jgi:putative hemolysin